MNFSHPFRAQTGTVQAAGVAERKGAAAMAILRGPVGVVQMPAIFRADVALTAQTKIPVLHSPIR